MTYQAPLADIGFALKYGAGLGPAIDEGLFGDLSMDVVDAVLAEAGRIAGRPAVHTHRRVATDNGHRTKELSGAY